MEHGNLARARTVDEALEAANRSGMPPHNVVIGDKTGRIGWTINGRIPIRVGFDGRIPTSWADGSRRWDGWLAPHETPRIVDPPSGRLWTANARVVNGEMLAKIGDGGYELGARARQIRDSLMKLEKATSHDLLAIQLDDRALFFERWRGVLLAALTPATIAADPSRRELRRLVETTWTGRASVDSAAYRAVRFP
jgi:penicillin amidase